MMKLFKTAAVVLFIGLAGIASVTPARADEWNKKTVMTFSGPVEIPGVHLAGFAVLPAGTYVFKLLDSSSDRHIVQIFSEDEKTVYATILAIPNYRLKSTDKTVITFRERPAGEPEALRAWFYPGANWGEEFVYGKAKAVELAKTSAVPVLFMPAEAAAEVTSHPATPDMPVVVELKRQPVMAIQPTGEEVELAAVVAPVPAALVADTAATLPATASNTPLLALGGLLALAAAFSLRAYAKSV